MSYSASNPPALAEPRPGLLRGCCCCCNLRQGVLILSALGFLGALLGSIPGSYGTGTFATIFGLQVVVNLIVMGFSILGFVGAYNYNEKFTKIYYFFTIVQLVISIVGVIVSALTINDWATVGCVNTVDVPACEAAVQSSFYISSALTILISVYFLAVIYAFWRQLQDTYAGKGPAGHQHMGGGAPQVVVIQNGQAQPQGAYGQPQPQGTYAVAQPMPTGGGAMQPVYTASAMQPQPVPTASVMQPVPTGGSIQPVPTDASAPPPDYDGTYPQLGGQDSSFDPPQKS